MSIVLDDCPHCGAKNTAFSMLASCPEAERSFWSVFARCNACGRGVIFHFMRVVPAQRSGRAPHELSWIELSDTDNWALLSISPPAREAESIDHLPPSVETAFMDAERSHAAYHITAAGMMYRKAVERAVRMLNPDGEGMLNKRIRALEKTNALPQSLIDLMDHVKLIGNDSAHEDEDPSPEDVEVARDFTRLLLTYLFELPGKVAAANERRAEIEASR